MPGWRCFCREERELKDRGRPISVEGRRILVVGLGITGKACAAALPELGAQVVVTDVRGDLEPLGGDIRQVEERGARFAGPEEAAEVGADVVVVSPGLSMKDARLAGMPRDAEWMSEIELGYRLSRGRILAVTGTNGKSTVATLAGKVLEKRFGDVRVSGNIGSAFIEEAVRSGDETVHVIEISSYQLEGCSRFRPDVGIVLNVQPDHRERHPTLVEYAAAKARLLQAMGPEEHAVLYREDGLVRDMAAGTKARVAWFSDKENIEEGACAGAGKLKIAWAGRDVEICAVEEMKLKGAHNVGNVLAVSMGTYLLGAQPEDIRAAAVEFGGLEHRIQTEGFVGGVECVNDSKGTNVDSVLAALETFEGREVTLILCGDDKKFDYRPLYAEIERRGVRVLVMGEGLKRVAEEMAARGRIEMRRAGTMKEAVELGCEMTPAGGVLLLSPSSSSFDMYKNFMERGRDFRNEVEKKKTGEKKAGA